MLSNPLISAVAPARMCLNVWFVSYTLLVCDYFYTLEAEVNDIWTCQFSPGLLLFYLNRYLPLVDIFLFMRPLLTPEPVSEKECKWIYPTTFWLVTFSLMVSQSVMVLRTYAIWGRRRLILWILTPVISITFISMMAVGSWKTYHDYIKLQSFLMPPEDASLPADRCRRSALSIDKKGSIIIFIFYLTVFVGETAIFTLTAIKASKHVSKSSPRWVLQLYKNGIIYCVCMLSLSLINSIVVFSAPAAFKPIFLPAQRTLHSIFSSRVVLLIFRHRNFNMPESNTHDRRRLQTYAESTMAVFTSVLPATVDSDMDDNLWQTRAEMEWIR